MAKRVLIVCGTGVATSTVVVKKVTDHIARKGYDATVSQGKVADLLSGTDADLIIATTQVPSSVTAPVIQGLPFLTGVGVDGVFAQIDEQLG